MRYEIEANGRLRRVTVRRANGMFEIEVDGRAFTVDAARIDSQTLSLLISGAENGCASHEVTLVANGATGRLSASVNGRSYSIALDGGRRSRRGVDAAHDGGGPQRIAAPMPGKVVRVLAKAGDVVQARQPVVVIEAMKMENELRSGRDGVVVEMHVREGQSVDAGTLLAVIGSRG